VLGTLLGAGNTWWMSTSSAPNALSVQQREGMFSTVVYKSQIVILLVGLELLSVFVEAKQDG